MFFALVSGGRGWKCGGWGKVRILAQSKSPLFFLGPLQWNSFGLYRQASSNVCLRLSAPSAYKFSAWGRAITVSQGAAPTWGAAETVPCLFQHQRPG